MSNLPDDWGAYRSRCPRCRGWNHDSGTEVCPCREAESELQMNVESWLASASADCHLGRWQAVMERVEEIRSSIEEWLAGIAPREPS